MYRNFYPFLVLGIAILHPFISSAQNNRIENTGNVGIGTTAPVVRLSVYGPSDDSAAISLQSGTNSRFYIQQGGTMLKIGGVTPGTGVINVLNTGRVGIGTNAPASTLDVNGDFRLGINTGGSAYSIGFTRAGNAQVYGLTSAGLALGGDATGIDAVILPNGNIGIGTTTPSEKLEIAGSVGNIQLSGSGAKIAFTRNNANYIDAITTGGFLIFSTNGAQERMRIDANGSVGIGTSQPGSHKLAVEGSIGARRVKVTQTAWADFVFHPDYNLPVLFEVEKFIKTNRHLPDIPSAAEVEKEGLDLGEMNKKLLQKVEELTLYLIDMKKEINQLKEQNELLNKRINTSAQK